MEMALGQVRKEEWKYDSIIQSLLGLLAMTGSDLICSPTDVQHSTFADSQGFFTYDVWNAIEYSIFENTNLALHETPIIQHHFQKKRQHVRKKSCEARPPRHIWTQHHHSTDALPLMLMLDQPLQHFH